MAKHVVDTGLNVVDSRLAINNAMKSYGERFPEYKPSYTWNSQTEGEFSCDYKGNKIGGRVVLLDGKLEIIMNKLPWGLAMFESLAVAPVTAEIKRWADAVRNHRNKQGA